MDLFGWFLLYGLIGAAAAGLLLLLMALLLMACSLAKRGWSELD